MLESMFPCLYKIYLSCIMWKKEGRGDVGELMGSLDCGSGMEVMEKKRMHVMFFYFFLFSKEEI